MKFVVRREGDIFVIRLDGGRKLSRWFYSGAASRFYLKRKNAMRSIFGGQPFATGFVERVLRASLDLPDGWYQIVSIQDNGLHLKVEERKKTV